MSIQSDKWIIKKCEKPTHVCRDSGKWFWEGVDNFIPGRVQYSPVSNIQEVSIADLLRFAEQNPSHGMISPFEREQVRSEKPRPFSVHQEILRQCKEEGGIWPRIFHREDEWDAAELGRVARSPKKISYGVSSYGYDVRCADEFKIFTNINSQLIDPKNFNDKVFVDHKGPTCIIPPNSFALARTVEFFKIPRNVLTVCLGKSTYARCGIIVNVTPLEPEWEGHVTLEFSNTTNLPAMIYANEGVAQMLFFEGNEECLTSYKDRGGKYQGQLGVTLPKA